MDNRLWVAFFSFSIFLILSFPTNMGNIKSTNIIYTNGNDFIYLDKLPVIKYPDDLPYIYLGKNHFNLTFVNMGYKYYNFTPFKIAFSMEFSRANITFSYNVMKYTTNNYRISYLIKNIWITTKSKYKNTDLILVITNMKVYADSLYDNRVVVGCAYVEYHTAFVFNYTSNKNKIYIGMHEVGHLIGLIHTNDYSDIMYPIYHGQKHFGNISLERLKLLHQQKATTRKFLMGCSI